MTTVKELKEWLNRFPDDTIVQVLKQDSSSPGNGANFGDLILDDDLDFGEGWDYADYSKNKNLIPGDPLYNKKYLALGSD